MVGMLLPSAAPAILLYGGLSRANRDKGQPTASIFLFVAGYLFAWTLFSVVVAGFQIALGQLFLMSPMMVATSTYLSGGLLLVAGIYQWSPIKDACLTTCRSPLQYFGAN
jgi:predicted metal-binding membrane protein